MELAHTVNGTRVPIRYVETDRDVADFRAAVSRSAPVAIDTETTGLDIYSAGHRVRLVQFGTATEAFVLAAEQWPAEIRWALALDRPYLMHNMSYDLLVLDRHGLARLEDLGPRVTDTYILAHLTDPRGKAEGGSGLGLKDLATIHVCPDATDGKSELLKEFRAVGGNKSTGWALVGIRNEAYVRYAGLDVVYTARLAESLVPLVEGAGLDGLSEFEHHLAILLAILQRRGMLIDVPYTERLCGELTDEEAHYTQVAARYGVTSVNATKQVVEALTAMGENWRETTPSGAPSVGKEVLLPMADLDRDWHRIGAREPNPLADAVLRAKRGGKWAKTYAQAFLDLRDESDRLHPDIRGLQARTARMSVGSPPLQQLPSSDWRIRRAFVAERGYSLFAVDYEQVEMRILAALAHEETMKEAIASGVDLHDFTAAKVFGDDFTKAQRKIAKAIGFGKVYGGGATSIARQTGAPFEKVQEAVAAYDAVYPGVKRFARVLQRRAQYGKVEVVTPSGRHLPLDRDRLYAATNYVVQSTARDLFAQAIVDLFSEGLGDYLLLPVHDEIVGQAPAHEVEEVAQAIRRVMERDFFGVPITSDAEVLGPSWGHGYGATE